MSKLYYDNSSYVAIVDEIHCLYDYNISINEAHEAARNAIGFCKIILEMQRKRK